ncbi:tetratricopeptide repeat protein [Pseudoalteromonas sp. NSLLW24]|uniref:tetratricopeptide repeat protein n=1 Tax=Pseudoalteromonas sp. NSLLW24 TaxID=2792050 RepID=UPI0018CE73A9|nr:tetratricopeptide repeat protein [Pseudoalteromonas sp. NSLLW24]MBG9998899.1 tetratricopeptide repeat protein [Pseudoalteromonas sp. NSLLW24]
MEKILKKYTTIPPHLYVNRRADKQLNGIINDMQRPGYVLVARQMGKTNLLFNAKRTMENERRIFAYVDMSNAFNRERECYQNIIDLIIEPNERKLSESLESEIYDLRKRDLPPHKEYTRSLKLILNDFDGDLVVILDEIDALKTSDYSDNIFAQIRSNYFARTSFPEFERLTYVLSGVIEPIELIKDRNKSPFNIGDKIYLDDFNKSEFNNFIEMSNICIDADIAERIFYWTNGNPRLTFDICSDVESLVIEEGQINAKALDKLIEEKYLISYDHAPIDHIRELVKSNKKIISSLIDIHEHPDIKITDEIKKKLYLFGIITSDFNGVTKFKNPIIEKSLQLNWLKLIWNEDDKKKYTHSYGLAFFDSEDYKEAIEVFEYLINNNDDVSDDIRYLLGFSYFRLGLEKKAEEVFCFNFTENPYRNRAICLGGICKLKRDDKSGLDELEKVINDTDSFTSNNALLNLAKNIEDKERALFLLKKIDSSSNEESNNQFKLASLYTQHEIQVQNSNPSKAIEALEDAMKYANPSESIAIKLEICSISNSESDKKDLVKTLLNNNLKFKSHSEFNLGFNKDTFIKCLKVLFDKSDLSHFNQLVKYANNNLRLDEQTTYEFIFNAAILDNVNKDILFELEKYIDTINLNLQLKLYRQLSIISHGTKSFIYYFNLFNKTSIKMFELAEEDLYLYGIALQEFYNLKLLTQAIEVCKDLELRLSNQDCNEISLLTSSTIFFWRGVVHLLLDDKYQASAYFTKTTSIINNSNYKETQYLNVEHFESIFGFEKKMKEVQYDFEFGKRKVFPSSNKTNTRQYTQKEIVSVRYIGGLVKKGKYKRFSKDLMQGRCEILS